MKQLRTLMPKLTYFHSIFLLGAVLLAASAFTAADSAPCPTNTEVRQLDFWLGDWTITMPGASHSSKSNVRLSLNQCLFVESWDNGKGHTGENVFAYSPDDQTWHGMFADSENHVHVFLSGRVSAGTAEFQGPSRGPNGETVLNRIRLIRTAPDKLEQTWDKSTDNGGSWNTIFQGEYRRANR